MKKDLTLKSCLYLLTFLTIFVFGDALAQVSFEDATLTRITSNAQPQNVSKQLNLRGHTHHAITSYKGYQYAAFYSVGNNAANRSINISRRKLPSGSWENIRFTDYTQTRNDRHNVISIGICEGDGTIHMAFDHHNSGLNYRISTRGLATNPGSHDWKKSKFGGVLHALPGTTANSAANKQWTYPRFVRAPNGDLLLMRRHGSAISGASHIYTYGRNSHTWRHHGEFIDGRAKFYTNDAGKRTKLGPYLYGAEYHGNRLHIAWNWRTEGTTSDQNFDLMYAYSDDHGKTWYNNNASKAGTSGSDPMTFENSPRVKVMTFREGSGVLNQTGLTVDNAGRVHLYQRQNGSPGEGRKMGHVYRDTDGDWALRQTDFNGERGKITHDPYNNAIIIHKGGAVFAATPGSDYKNWSQVRPADSSYKTGEALFDHALMASDSILSLLLGKTGASKQLYSMDLRLKSSVKLSIESFSAQQSGNPAKNLLDGRKGDDSRWSAKNYSQEVVIDLGAQRRVKGFKVWTYQDRAYRYELRISNSASSGFNTRVVNRTGNTSNSQPINDSFAVRTGRYLKFKVTGAHNYSGPWVSINEVEVVFD